MARKKRKSSKRKSFNRKHPRKANGQFKSKRGKKRSKRRKR